MQDLEDQLLIRNLRDLDYDTRKKFIQQVYSLFCIHYSLIFLLSFLIDQKNIFVQISTGSALFITFALTYFVKFKQEDQFILYLIFIITSTIFIICTIDQVLYELTFLIGTHTSLMLYINRSTHGFKIEEGTKFTILCLSPLSLIWLVLEKDLLYISILFISSTIYCALMILITQKLMRGKSYDISEKDFIISPILILLDYLFPLKMLFSLIKGSIY
ncbi:hypothetical protein pb186bvf_003260 [Paramecium bursaria]